MHVVVSVRRTLVAHPWIYWLSCLACAAGAALAVHGYTERFAAQQRAWGTTAEVWLAADDVGAGEVVVAEPINMPLALVPADAVASRPADAIARQRITAGEVIVAADVTAPAGPATLADRGTVVVGLVDPLARDLAIGLRIHVVADGVVLARDATIVGLRDDVVQIAVAADDGAIVAMAAHDGTASIVFVP